MFRVMHVNEAELSDFSKELLFMAENARLVLDALPYGKKSLTFVEGILVALLANKSRIESIDGDQRKHWLQERAKEFASLPVYVSGPRYALSSAGTVRARLSASINVFAD
jgi:hypothetical protein